MFKELIIGSGGIYLVHKTGALKGLSRIQPIDSFQYYTGCSAGGVLAGLIVLGYDTEEIVEWISSVNFADHQNLKIQTMMEYYGLDDGNGFYQMAKYIFEQKGFDPHITFLELYTLRPKILTLCVANVTKGESEYHNLFTTPNFRVIDSLLMSMNIPFLFKPMKKSLTYLGNFQSEHIYVDGALYDPFPYRIMKRVPPHKKLGILKTKHGLFETVEKEMDMDTSPSTGFMESLPSYAIHLIQSVMNHHMRYRYRFLFEERFNRNIYCIYDTGVSPVDLSMDPMIKRRYMEEHEEAFFQFYQSLIRKNYLMKKYVGVWRARVREQYLS